MAGKNRPSRHNLDSSDSPVVQSDDFTMDRVEQMFGRLTKMVTDSFSACITHLTSALDDKFNTKIEAQASEIFSLSSRIDQMDRRINDLTNSNRDLSAKVLELANDKAQLQLSIDNLEQYSRSDSILIHGFPLPAGGAQENLYTEIPSILNNLIPSVNLTPDMISVTHRLPSQAHPNSASTSNQPSKPPPIVVRFARKATRIALLANRRHLKGKSIVLTEHLTPARAALLKKATALVNTQKLSSAWTQDGKVLVKTAANRTVHVLHEDDLRQFN
jgi:hypothetical protein